MSPRQPDLQLFDVPTPGGNRDAVGRALRRLDERRKSRPDYEEELAFSMRAQRLPRFERQYYFAKELGRRFAADFAWPKYKLLVEVQGGIWRPGGGAHSHPLDIERDVERQQYVAILRWTVLPVLPKEVRNGHAVELILMVLEKLGWDPTTITTNTLGDDHVSP